MCISELSKSRVIQWHSCLQEHRSFISLSLICWCCHVGCFPIHVNLQGYYYYILPLVLFRLSHIYPFLFVSPSCISTRIIFLLPEGYPFFPLVWVFGKLYFSLKRSLLCLLLEAYFCCVWNRSWAAASSQRTAHTSPLSSASLVAAQQCLLGGWVIWRSSAFYLLAVHEIFFVFGFLQFHCDVCRCGFLIYCLEIVSTSESMDWCLL